MTLLINAKSRKTRPLASGVLDYFPDALIEVAYVSFIGNEQHNPGTPLHWDKSKSSDEADCLLRHLLERGTRDTDGLRHTAKVAWRALALLQRELDAENQKTQPSKDDWADCDRNINADGSLAPQGPITGGTDRYTVPGIDDTLSQPELDVVIREALRDKHYNDYGTSVPDATGDSTSPCRRGKAAMSD